MTQLGRPKGLLPTWATDDNYPAGSEQWSETPTKIDLSAAERAAGFTPGRQVSAQKMNANLHMVGRYIEMLSDIGVRNWPYVGLQGDHSELTSGFGTCIAPWTGGADDALAPDTELWVIGGSSSEADRYLISGDRGVTWTKRGNAPADIDSYMGSATEAAGGLPGTIIIAGLEGSESGTHIMRSTNSAQSWSRVQAHAIAKFDCSALHYAKHLGVHVMAGNQDFAGGRLLYSSDDGATWALTTSLDVIPSHVRQFASNDEVIVACGDTSTLSYSLDGGETWVTTSPGIAYTNGWAGLAYSEEEGQFMLLADNTRLATSEDGINWVVRNDQAVSVDTYRLAASGGAHGKGLAVVGSTWAATAAITIENGFNLKGVLYSNDLGKNWSFVPIGRVPASSYWSRIQAARDHFMVCRQGSAGLPHVYASMSVGRPAPTVNFY